MLVSDSFAALTTVAVLWLLSAGQLKLSHLYVINALNGLMNTAAARLRRGDQFADPAPILSADCRMRYFSNSLVTMLTPALATAVLALAGLRVAVV